MRTFESRAIENIATAPATAGDRRWAAASALAIVALFVVSIPFSRMRIAAVPAFVPSVVGAAVVALVLTTFASCACHAAAAATPKPSTSVAAVA